MTVTNALATAYSNQKKEVVLSTGRKIVVVANTTTNAKFLWSDDGLAWTDFGSDIAGWVNGSIVLVTDSGGTRHIVTAYEKGSGEAWLRSGTLNAGATTLTWGAELRVDVASYTEKYPDLVAVPYSTGIRAMVVQWRCTGSGYYVGRIINITSADVASIQDWGPDGSGSPAGVATPGFVSLALNESNYDIHMGIGYPASGAGKGIRYQKMTWNSGTGLWSWASIVDVTTTLFVSEVNLSGIQCRWDGTRVIIGGSFATDYSFKIYDSTDFTTFTLRATASGTVYGSSFAVDTSTGHIHGFALEHNGTNYSAVKYVLFTRSGSTLSAGSYIKTDAGILPGSYVNAYYADSIVQWIYTFGASSPYQVKYDQIVLNVAPDVPTNLARVLPNTDTSPSFTADLVDSNTGQLVKARFTLYQSDGTTLIGTVDSTFAASPHTATAEYSAALGVGTYKVKVSAIDDLGAQSADSAQITFYVTASVSEDLTLLWNVLQNVTENLTLLWNVLAANQKDLILLWNNYIALSKSLELQWQNKHIWTLVEDATDPTWTEVYQ